MKKYILSNTRKALTASLFMATSLLFVTSCTDDQAPVNPQDHNFAINVDTRSADLATAIQNMQLYTFNRNTGAANDKTFHRKILNMVRTDNQITAQVETGFWYMAMVSPPQGVSIIEPVAGATMDKLPMYKWVPTYNDTEKRHNSAPEILFVNTDIPEIKEDKNATAQAKLGRNIARVKLVLEKVTSNFELVSNNHELILSDVPSTISYTGALLPERDDPSLIENGLKANVTLKARTPADGFLCAEPIIFDIPAHRGDCDKDNPTDITTKKMKLTVKLQRAGGGSMFVEEDIVIDKVAICNHILQVNITVNDGVLFESSIKKWEEVGLGGTIGAGYKNWLYVKSGVNGTGQSWSDPAPDITTAITRAQTIKAAGKTVHGILVAGGEGNTTYTYDEGLTIPADIRIFGGWEGKSGTELAAEDKDAPFKSTARDLKNKKVKLKLSDNNRVTLTANNSLLDGFIIDGATGTSGSLITVGHAGAAINAIEITNNTTTVTSTLNMTAGTASNVLIANNASGISITGGSKLINATVANNAGISNLAGSILLNSAFWRSGRTGAASSVLNCAFEGTLPSGVTNVGLNSNNTAWFEVDNALPGPHFDTNVNASMKYYEALNDRCPLIGRGSESNFDNNTPYIPVGYKKDIDGRDRHIINSAVGAVVTTSTDIGCYESPASFKGFYLSWATDEIRVSYQATYLAEYPLIIPNNDIYGIGITWTATWSQTATTSAYPTMTDTRNGNAVPSKTGNGTDMVVGSLFFRNAGASTPTNDYTGVLRDCGTISISTNLGNYLPNATIQVKQLPGNEYKYLTGYVGSFHRNTQVGARYVSFANTGAWEARIIGGLDWIKIDGNEKTYGVAITDPEEGTPPSGTNADTHYREVVQEWKGVVSGTGPVRFRVGMQSKNPNPDPRYGLIAITTTNGVSMFFVRQGEAPDFLYRSVDGKPNNNARTNLVKISPFNLTDPNNNTSSNGSDLGEGGATFVDFPTKVGYYFQWNDTKAYRPGQANKINTSTRERYTSWDTSREICPTINGTVYRHPSHVELINSVYYNVATPTDLSSTSNELRIDPGGADAKKNALWGAYADGYFDQLTVNTTLPTGSSYSVGSGPDMAVKGTLMVNHYNYSSIFYPGGGRMANNSSTLTATPYAMYYTTTYYYGPKNTSSTTYKSYYRGSNTHWQMTSQNDQHIGMNCTPIYYNNAGTTRCVTK